MEGFVDLREASDSGSASDSFWPSFTDMMMVVVMIFMIASTVLVLRNWELIADLRSTMDAERAASDLARATSEVNESLEERLARLEEQLTHSRMELLRSEEEGRSKAQLIAERDLHISQLDSAKAQLSGELQTARRQGELLDAQLQRLGDNLATLQRVSTEQESQLAATRAELEQSRSTARTAQEALATMRVAEGERAVQMAALQGEYDDLKVKYDKLVRPARTTAGKTVVEVRYEKVAGSNRISLREPGKADFQVVERATLERRLGALKAVDPAQLYVRIIIPDESGLSYNEAWSFTRDMLEGYDYYHQQP